MNHHGSHRRFLLSNFQQIRTIVKVRLKWVKNRALDHLIEVQTDLKAASLVKDAIVRTSTNYLTAKTLNDSQKLLGLTVPTLRFIRRYTTLFHEFPHPKWPSLPCFELTDIGKMLHQQELKIYEECESDLVQRVSRLLMMTKSRMVPLLSLHQLKWDFGLPDNIDKTLVKKYPDQFQIVKGPHGMACLKLLQWREEFATSVLQKMNEKKAVDSSDSIAGNNSHAYREFKKGKAALEFPMSFPRGYGAQKKVKTWMDEFQKLPYISPYEECKGIDPNSELMEKRVVGVLHEFLSLTIYKKTKRNYLRGLREELILPHKFTRVFTRYPGIFYLSLKCKTTTITLREGYSRGKLVDQHPLARHRSKFYHVMRTGLLYRGKGMMNILPKLYSLVGNEEVEDNVNDQSDQEEEEEEEEMEGDEEFYEAGTSDLETDSDEN